MDALFKLRVQNYNDVFQVIFKALIPTYSPLAENQSRSGLLELPGKSVLTMYATNAIIDLLTDPIFFL